MTILANNPSTGIGALTLVPAATPNGTPLGIAPTGAVGARFYLPVGAAVTFTVTALQPTTAPALVFTVSQASTGPNWDEALTGGQAIYVTATAGTPLFRWY
jgi:hypothetical protein